MAGQAKRASELRELAELVADTLTEWNAGRWSVEYQPTILSGAVAAAYDAAMARARCPVRAWRGSKAEGEQRGATKAQLAYRAQRFLCSVEFNSLGHVCQRAKGHAGPHYAEVRAQAVRS